MLTLYEELMLLAVHDEIGSIIASFIRMTEYNHA